MADSNQATSLLIREILDEYGSRISIDGGSKVLVSSINIASALADATTDVRTPYGPTITIAVRDETPVDPSRIPHTSVQLADGLKMDHFTHAVFGIAAEDPKYVLQGLKHMLYALQPKGIAIVISLKQETGQAEGSDSYVVGLEDKIKYQSRGKVERLTEVLEYAGFERGKIRSMDRSVELGGKPVEAEIVLAMKWDQLSA